MHLLKHTLFGPGLLFLLSISVSAQHAYVLSDNNPFTPVALSQFASPALGDIDNDGDLDLFVGQFNSNDMLFYRNTGDSQNPVFEQQTDADNPLDIYFSNSGGNAPALVDIDADGDLDVFVGIWTYLIRHLRNEGDPSTPDFVFQYNMNNPLDQVMTEGICSYPAFIDIDNDDDNDVFISDGNGNIAFYKNTGDQYMPIFTLDTVNNPLSGLGLTARTKIAFHDVSGDSLVDAVLSHDTDEPELLYFVNTGTPENAVFEQRSGDDNPFAGITGPEALVPTFADIDGDGDKDLVLGTHPTVRLYEAVMTSPTSDISAGMDVSIHPNPARDAVYITAEDLRSIEIYNLHGVLIRRVAAAGHSVKPDVSDLPRGIYSIRAVMDRGIACRRLVLQ